MTSLKLKPGTFELNYHPEEEVSIKLLRQHNKIIIELSESFDSNLNSLKSQINNLDLNHTDEMDNIQNIESSKDSKQYYTCNFTKKTCTCPDFVYRQRICKHLKQSK